MVVIESDNTVFFDCDDTLVTFKPNSTLSLKIDGFVPFLYAINQHINDLKEHKARGHKVVVWSAGGYEWAAQVVKLLDLTDYVDYVMCKPKWYYDDYPADEFMKRIYKLPQFVDNTYYPTNNGY